MNLKAVIFDIDGTLLDSNDAHAEAFVRGFKDAGYQVTFDEVRHAIGMGGDLLIPAVGGIEKKSDDGERISKRKKEIFFGEYFPDLKPFPRARELVEAIRRRGLRTAIATSADQEELQKFLSRIGIEDLMEVKTSKSDVQVSKPAPDVLYAALDKLGVSPEEAIFIGDTPYDHQAAKRAGVSFIAFRTGRWEDVHFTGAAAIYDSPADLLERLEESPISAFVTEVRVDSEKPSAASRLHDASP